MRRFGGQPSTTTPSAGPWDSPHVVKRNRWPKLLWDMGALRERLVRVVYDRVRHASNGFHVAHGWGREDGMDTLTIPRPDDWHLHLRDGAMLAGVLPESRDFARAIIMPNLVPPVVTGAQAAAYRKRILAALPEGQTFEPLMTLYLTETTDPDDVAQTAASGLVKAVKLYPAGATTNSDAGVRDIARVMPVLERMAEIGLPLCVHGEVTDADIDIFDREAVFIERVLEPLAEKRARSAGRDGAYHHRRCGGLCARRW